MTVELLVPETPYKPGLRLRPWNDNDVEPLIAMYRDPLLRHRTTLPVESIEDAAQWLDVQRRGWESGERLSFAVCELPVSVHEGRLVGNVALKRKCARGESAEVGYWTAAHARGQGVAPRALEALCSWAFATLASDGLDRLDLLHQVDNLASCRVAEKTGFRFREILPARPPFPLDGHVHTRLADTSALPRPAIPSPSTRLSGSGPALGSHHAT